VTEGPGRGRASLYWVALGLVAAAGVCLAVSARGFLESTRLLWVSTACSALAIVVAVASVVWLARDR
jgi:hypothetical protein